MPAPSRPARRPDASLSLAQYRRRADRYDLELAAFEPLRRQAIDLLAPKAGDTVLDVGCGTGLSFAPLRERIGARGRIVGIEPSPAMLAHARERIAREHHAGITLLESTAGAAPIAGPADAALFHFTHDVLRDPQALDHVLAHLKPGAHVVACGLQWAPAWCVPVNLFVLGAAMYSVTCLDLAQPWDLLAARLREVQVRQLGGGGIYLVSGRA